MTDTLADNRKLEREVEATRILMDRLKALIGDDDEQTLVDTFEGETTIDKAIRNALLASFEDEIAVEGIKLLVEKLTARRQRIEKRMDARRGLIEQAMVIANWKSKQFDVATLSISKAGKKVEIDDESQIPTQFFKRADPKLDKAGLGKVLKERDNALTAALAIVDPDLRERALQRVDEELPLIPGAHLEDGGVTLTIRRS